jgi:hypothetical protein
MSGFKLGEFSTYTRPGVSPNRPYTKGPNRITRENQRPPGYYLHKVDEDLLRMVGAIERSDLSLEQIAERALRAGWFITVSTLRSWCAGRVRTPHNYSVNAARAGLGLPPRSWPTD